MERQEEEEEEKRRSLSPSTSLPLDLTSEVLIRLPAKSIARSRCVSKHWSSCTTLACFNKSFTARSSQIPCLLILALQSDKKLVGFSLPEHGNSDSSSSSPVDSFLIKFPQDCYFIFTSSVQGLYCFQGPSWLLLWNPTMRRFSPLTKPESLNWKNMTGFVGYDPIDGTYKALCMPYVAYPEARPKNSSNEPRVLTLGRSDHQESSWRIIQGSFEHFPTSPSGLCVNGVVYYKSYLTSDYAEYCMMSFHVRSEKFKIIQVPWKECLPRCKLLSYNGKLASVTCSSAVISLWVLEDAERHEWSFKSFTLPFPLDDPVLQKPLELAGVTHGGEFVYVPSGIHLLSRFHALYFDPLRNSFRRVVYEGIGDDEFRRRSGLGNEPLCGMLTLPNHVETLMSL